MPVFSSYTSICWRRKHINKQDGLAFIVRTAEYISFYRCGSGFGHSVLIKITLVGKKFFAQCFGTFQCRQSCGKLIFYREWKTQDAIRRFLRMPP